MTITATSAATMPPSVPYDCCCSQDVAPRRFIRGRLGMLALERIERIRPASFDGLHL